MNHQNGPAPIEALVNREKDCLLLLFLLVLITKLPLQRNLSLFFKGHIGKLTDKLPDKWKVWFVVSNAAENSWRSDSQFKESK